MLTGQYENHAAAVLEFTQAECVGHPDGHVATCLVTLRQSVGGAIIEQRTSRLPVADHMEPADIAALFQSQYAMLPQFKQMLPA